MPGFHYRTDIHMSDSRHRRNKSGLPRPFGIRTTTSTGKVVDRWYEKPRHRDQAFDVRERTAAPGVIHEKVSR